MSTNDKNTFRPGYLKNFTRDLIERYIIVDNGGSDTDKDVFVREINETLYSAIQEVNVLEQDRIIKFVTVRRVVEINGELRVIINDIDSSTRNQDYQPRNGDIIELNSLSHLINFKSVNPRRIIQVSDDRMPSTAKMIIGKEDQIRAATDIFLDIAMFHSFPFLESMTLAQKKEFSENKYMFARDNSYGDYYDCSFDDPPAYWSLAFSARDENGELDYEKYVYYWNEYLGKYYGNELSNNNEIQRVTEQLMAHVDYDNIDNRYKEEEFWREYADRNRDNDAYLFCRINRNIPDNQRKDIISKMFGITTFHVGAIAIFPIDKMNNRYFEQLLANLYISAFKIVIPR